MSRDCEFIIVVNYQYDRQSIMVVADDIGGNTSVCRGRQWRNEALHRPRCTSARIIEYRINVQVDYVHW